MSSKAVSLVTRHIGELNMLVWGLAGFSIMMVLFALDDAGLGFGHMALCLSGERSWWGPAAFLGHCGWCYAAVGAAMSGVLLSLHRAR